MRTEESPDENRAYRFFLVFFFELTRAYKEAEKMKLIWEVGSFDEVIKDA